MAKTGEMKFHSVLKRFSLDRNLKTKRQYLLKQDFDGAANFAKTYKFQTLKIFQGG